jgi:hypothetical protein
MPFQKTPNHFMSLKKIRELSILSRGSKEFKFFPFLYKIVQFRLINLFSFRILTYVKTNLSYNYSYFSLNKR